MLGLQEKEDVSIDNLEKIQRGATRMMELEAWRIRANMIKLLKITKGLEGLKREDFFEMEEGQTTRRHS